MTKRRTATSNERRNQRPVTTPRKVTSPQQKVLDLEIHQILNILPQRYPFVMIDRVTEVLANDYARGHKCVSYNEPFFRGHFPNRPVMPGVLVVEALSQLASVLAYVSQPFDPTTSMLYVVGIDNVRFRRTVVPGDRVDLYVEVSNQESNAWKFTADATVDGAVVVEGELLASVVDNER